MGLVTGAVVFTISWWMVFFITLPIGIRTQEEEGDVTHGSMGSAPTRPRLLMKAAVAAVFAGILTYVADYGMDAQWIELREPIAR